MRRWAAERTARPVSEATAAEYRRVYERLRREKRRAGTSENGRSRSVERSAFRYYSARLLGDLLERGDLVRAAALWSELNAVEREAREAKEEYEKRIDAGEHAPNTQVRHTKRRSLRGLPPDWREQLCEAAAGSRYGAAMRVMALCGCRPAELAKGITVTRTPDGALVLRVPGAKRSERTGGGQSWREITIDADHPLASGLEPGVYAVPTAKAIQNAVDHYARKLWPRKKEGISPYSLRHALASDVKASELEVEEVAQALGHASTATMDRYGSASGSGKGGLKVRAVSAERAPRAASKAGKRRRGAPRPR